MLGEHHELKNRYMLIGYNDTDEPHTSTHTSTHTSFDETASTLSENIKRLLVAIGTDEKSVKEMMEAVGLIVPISLNILLRQLLLKAW